jgi:hypothetical protein
MLFAGRSGFSRPRRSARAPLSTSLVTAALLFAAPVAAFFTARPAHASLVLAMDLPSLTEEADRVVVGEVMSVKSAWDAEHRRILTTVEVQVAEAWKGEMPSGRTLKIVQPGGVVDDIEMKVHGLPRFSTGERAVLFLRGSAINASLVGLGQGKRGLSLDQGTRRWMAAPADRSAAVKVDERGQMQPAPASPGDERMPLDDLRSRVRALLQKR